MPESATRPAATQPRGADALVHGGGRRPGGASAASFHTQGWSIEHDSARGTDLFVRYPPRARLSRGQSWATLDPAMPPHHLTHRGTREEARLDGRE